MKTIKKWFVLIPLLITVLLIVIGISVLIAKQPNESKIYTGSELTRFLEKDAGQPGKRAVLYADITLEKAYEAKELVCEFDGNGHTVTVRNNNVPYLFDSVAETGRVKNLVLAGKLGGTDNRVTAGICLRNFGTIENCFVCADFSGDGFVDGVCHTNSGHVLNCFVRSYESGDKERRYVWNPICAENAGEVKGCFYSDASTGEYDTAGTHIPADEIGDIAEMLNEYCKNKPGLIEWEADEAGYPAMRAEDGSEAASVFSGGIGVFLACIIVLIIAVPIFTIIYVDRQKKKVIYSKP